MASIKNINSIVTMLLVCGLLTSCATTPPRNINNICDVLKQKSGFLTDWRSSAVHASKKYNVPLPLILATIYKESSFNSTAKSERTKLGGFIPWKRKSTAYGYSQALNNTWLDYVKETKYFYADRSNFAHSTDFIGWYYQKSIKRHKLAPNDYKNLYLSYYLGYSKSPKSYKNVAPNVLRSVQKLVDTTLAYEKQLKNCNR